MRDFDPANVGWGSFTTEAAEAANPSTSAAPSIATASSPASRVTLAVRWDAAPSALQENPAG